MMEINVFQAALLGLFACLASMPGMGGSSIGNYTLEEPVPIGDLIIQSQSTALSYENDDFYYVINSTVDLNSTGAPDTFDNAGSGVYGGVLYGSKWYAYKNKDTVGQIIKDVNDAGKIDGILNIFMIPDLYIQVDSNTSEVIDSESLTITNTAMTYPTQLDGYTPVNKKLLTYPYVQVQMTNNGNTYNHTPHHHTQKAIERMSRIKIDENYTSLNEDIKSIHSGSYGRLNPHGIAPTITTRFDTPSGGKFIHPYQNRTISPREAARLQSFPDSFEFVGNQSSICKQIGNAVPPKLAYYLAIMIKEVLNEN